MGTKHFQEMGVGTLGVLLVWTRSGFVDDREFAMNIERQFFFFF